MSKESPKELHVDVLQFGGGPSGLWPLRTLTEKGYSTILVEKDYLGNGQTISSQGTIYGGVKYGVGKAFRADSVQEIKGMPRRWREHLSGKLSPDLSDVKTLSDSIYLWVPKGRKMGALFSRAAVNILESK